MNIDLLDLIEAEPEEVELIPEILPMDAKFSISGVVAEFVNKLQSAVAVTPVKEIIPNTIYVHVKAVDSTPILPGKVEVAATDGERSIMRESTDLTVNLAGEGLLPGRRLLEILRLASEPTFRLDVFTSSASIRSGRAVWTIKLPDASQLPPFPDTATVTLHEVSRLELVKSLETVVTATAHSSARMSLTQIQFFQGGVVGCDGARLHRVKNTGLPKSFKSTLPTSLVETFLKELKSSSVKTALIGSNHSTVVLKLDQDILTGQRLTLEYPNVDHLMLEPAMLNNEELTFSVSDVRDAVKRVRVNADPDMLVVYLGIRSVQGEWVLTIRAVDKRGNSSQETLPVAYTGSTAREIAVNHRYLLALLGCISDSEATFKLGEDTKTKKAPVFVQTEDFTGVLMPMATGFSF